MGLTYCRKCQRLMIGSARTQTCLRCIHKVYTPSSTEGKIFPKHNKQLKQKVGASKAVLGSKVIGVRIGA